VAGVDGYWRLLTVREREGVEASLPGFAVSERARGRGNPMLLPLLLLCVAATAQAEEQRFWRELAQGTSLLANTTETPGIRRTLPTWGSPRG